jgi:hypothetical protein
MDEIDQLIASAWCEAQDVLGIRVVSPAQLQATDGSQVSYVALVKDFGTAKGTLILTDHSDSAAMRLAEKQGYFCSCLFEPYTTFDRKLFIDTLNDWGWVPKDSDAPDWYTGEPWTS